MWLQWPRSGSPKVLPSVWAACAGVSGGGSFRSEELRSQWKWPLKRVLREERVLLPGGAEAEGRSWAAELSVVLNPACPMQDELSAVLIPPVPAQDELFACWTRPAMEPWRAGGGLLLLAIARSWRRQGVSSSAPSDSRQTVPERVNAAPGMKSPRQRENRGRQQARSMGGVQGEQSVCTGSQEHVLLFIMGKALTRQHWKPLFKVVRLLFSI